MMMGHGASRPPPTIFIIASWQKVSMLQEKWGKAEICGSTFHFGGRFDRLTKY